MIKTDDLVLMSNLWREKSIAGVAKRMHLTPSAISFRLSNLEKRLGVRLAERNGRSGIVLTADGEFLAKRGDVFVSELNILFDEVHQRQGRISGTVRIVAPFGLGRRHIAPLLGQISRLYPELIIDLHLTDDLSRPPNTVWDILIRVSPFADVL